ncbi:Gfo/Idh/MocA family protein [Pedobacter nanyangensis]|uniref:Gfo/Idh/MocA family protein n=1 Tax=Pedobacter nanyangensis TaxID=1562389 RepID=UPI000DE452AC|nr:Gfo/Idh/MocA family oxidoreductase [Pedobacter nanyangensis]
MNEIKWGIIGCGDVTEVKSGPAFNKVPHSKLVAVMRRDAAKAQDYAKRHAVPKWYSNAADLINDAEVNAIYIATPPLQHETYTLAALAAGKPVYVEKPMALNGIAAQNMANAAQQHGIKLVVAHYRRAQPLFLKIKSLLEANTIGQVRLVDLKMLQPKANQVIANTAENWRINPAISGGGLFHDLAPHQLDLMLYYFGNVKQFNGLAHKKDAAEPVEDLVTGHILFENGVVFNGMWCFSSPKNEQTDRCEIYGSKGKISFSVFGQSIKISVDSDEQLINFEPLQHVQQPMIEQVVAYFRNLGPNPCSAEEALVTMKLMDGFTGKNN